MRFSVMVIAAVLLFPSGSAGDSRVPLPPIPQGDGEQCVEPTGIMRRDHMNFLFHQRDLTVHDGIRSKRHSLTGCIACHAGRDSNGSPIRVDAPGQFCDSCHRYAAVTIDCFGCHAATPQ